MEFNLPPLVTHLVEARNKLLQHYDNPTLNFTFDGKLVGDIGEAVASELFGIKLYQQQGIDGSAPDGRTVQIKATGTNRGPAFRYLEEAYRAQHFIFLNLDFDRAIGRVEYNGPEALFLNSPPFHWQGQRMFTLNHSRRINALVSEAQRLPIIYGT